MDNDRGFLHRYFLSNGGKSCNKWIHYFDIYERHLARFREKSPTLFEIGVRGGGSLSMWKSYFGHGAQIIGLDINPKCQQHADDQIDVIIGDQSDSELLESIIADYGPIDIIIDDGSHKPRDVIGSFETLYSQMSPTGVYIIEDTHTSYWSNYGGGLKARGSVVEYAKDRVDELTASLSRGAVTPTHITETTDSLSFYDSMIVFERRPQGERQSFITHGMDRSASD